MKKLALTTMLSLASIPLGVGMASAERGADGRLDILYWQAVTVLNPYISSGTKDMHAASVVLEPLARFDTNGDIVPTLAAEVPSIENGGIPEDRSSITWRLKPGLLWSDGTPVTSEDVVFTHAYCMAPGSGCSQLASFPDIDRVEALDPLTVKIVFTAPKPFPFSTFVGASSPILQKAQFENCLGEAAKSCTDQNFYPIGTGPFRVTDFKTNDVATFEANPNYRDPSKPAFQTLVIKGGGDARSAAQAVFATGEADYAWNLQLPPEILSDLAAQGRGEMVAGFGTLVEFLTLNLTNPDPSLGDLRSTIAGGPHPFNTDPAVQRALSMALDRSILAETGYGAAGRPVCNMIAAPAIYVSTTNDWCLTPDVAGANRLLDEAGWLRGPDGIRAKDGVRLELTMSSSTNTVRQDAQALIKSMWDEIGVRTNLRNVAAGVFFGGGADNPDNVWLFRTDMVMYGSSFAGTDPQTYMSQRLCKDIPSPETNWSGSNISRYCDPEYDALVEQLQATAPIEERADLVKRLNDMQIERAGLIPLVSRANVSGHARSLAGVQMNVWDSELWNIADWSRAK